MMDLKLSLPLLLALFFPDPLVILVEILDGRSQSRRGTTRFNSQEIPRQHRIL